MPIKFRIRRNKKEQKRTEIVSWLITNAYDKRENKQLKERKIKQA